MKLTTGPANTGKEWRKDGEDESGKKGAKENERNPWYSGDVVNRSVSEWLD